MHPEKKRILQNLLLSVITILVLGAVVYREREELNSLEVFFYIIGFGVCLVFILFTAMNLFSSSPDDDPE